MSTARTGRTHDRTRPVCQNQRNLLAPAGPSTHDPLVGPAGRMTIREEPLRRTVQVKTYVEMAGGDYFFLPSLPALGYLTSL
jgi:hypothetical protein